MRQSVVFLFLTLLLSIPVNAQEANGGRWSGLVYADYFYNVSRDTGFASLSQTAVGGVKDLNGFKFRRIYLTYDASISEVFSTRFRLEADEAANASNGRIASFVKDAYLKWKSIFAGSDLMVGIQPTPAFEVSESFWGYRSLEKTILDLRGIVSSRDQGISLFGTLAGSDLVRYKAMFANGSGNNPETDRYKKYYAHAEFRPTEQISATLYMDLSARPRLSTPGGSLGNSALTYAGFVGYRVKGSFSVGIEGFVSSLDHGYLNAGSYLSRSSFGLSAFGSGVITPEATIVARFDMYDPNTHTSAKGDSRNFLLFGLDWKPDGRVSLIPNVLVETYESIAGRAMTASVTGRLTMVYSF